MELPCRVAFSALGYNRTERKEFVIQRAFRQRHDITPPEPVGECLADIVRAITEQSRCTYVLFP